MENSHCSALLAKHAGLDARLAAENRRPAPNDMLIATLKKQKLKIKEALVQHNLVTSSR
ncbi:hypothetical protein CLG96_15300 [Sphingomonas oleivorans]|uniref:DUF465 domain-containing protein n=1 Tax=Sphingomonas oleivorans TaxID=1735121 RepID=A0A2T5FV22_9SPHN|nr:YdcH family protein [Sphingomonas oleivorans]PTQ08559.1 hypothetical protein CLG96_15300 [Sphingomonas oleivorans]